MANIQELWNQFTPEQVAALRQLMDSGDEISRGRTSPFRPRQLTRLDLPPTGTDARPLFIPSAESPRNVDVTKTFPYPRLLWSPKGVEITVQSRKEHDAKLAEGYQELPPYQAPVDPDEAAHQAFAQLSEADQQFVIEHQRQLRIQKLEQQLAMLSEASLENLLGSAKAQATGKKKSA